MNKTDRLICILPEALAVGDTFSSWPLHVTIVPWFRSNQTTDAVVDRLERLLATVEKFEVFIGEEGAKFGHQSSKRAALVQLPSPVVELEGRIRNFLHEENVWLVDESTEQKRDFKPHVTDQPNRQLHTGEHFSVDGVYVIEQMGDYKQIVGKILFHD